MIEQIDLNQLGTAGLFISYLIYDRKVILERLIKRIDRFEDKIDLAYGKRNN